MNSRQSRFVVLAFLLGSVVPSHAAIYRVDARSQALSPDGASWATAFPKVFAALARTVAGDEVWVAEGTYAESVTLPKDVGLYGGFSGDETERGARNSTSNVTTLKGSGILNGGGNSSVVTFPAAATSETVLDGFTITNGGGTEVLLSTTNTYCGRYKPTAVHRMYQYRGGGVMVPGGAPTIRHNLIAGNNTAHFFLPPVSACTSSSAYQAGPGGGIYLAPGATPVIEDNVIQGNAADSGGGVYAFGGTVLSANTITGNTATTDGGGMYLAPGAAGALPTVTGNTIAYNKAGGNGGGIAGGGTLTDDLIRGNTAAGSGGGLFGAETAAVDRCSFLDNAATDGGGDASPNGIALIRDSVFQGNAATHSGAAFTLGGSAMVANNTIAGNTGPAGSAVLNGPGGGFSHRILFASNIVARNQTGLAVSGAWCSLRSNDVWGNADADYVNTPAATGVDGNIAADPLFTNAAGGDLHLLAGSSCIDAGDTDLVPRTGMDRDGALRLRGSQVDIGASETAGAALVPPNGPIHVSQSGSDTNDGSTWTAAKATLQAALDAAWGRGGAEVWVEQGTYSGPFFARAPVALFGGFTGTESLRTARNAAPGLTILDAHQAGSVLYADDGVPGSFGAFTLDGFTVQNGLDATAGGGLTCGAVTIAVSNNIIQNNQGALGAGIGAWTARGTVSENTIRNNQGLPPASGTGSQGGGIAASSALMIVGNTIGENASDFGGGIYGDASIFRNVMTGNSAGSGGGAYGAGIIADNVFARNAAAGVGGGAYITANARVTNNTFVSNTATNDVLGQDGYYGGAIWVNIYPWNSGYTVIENNIVASNSTGIIFNEPYTSPGLFGNNDVFSNGDFNWSFTSPSPGNLSVDPLFVNQGQGNYHLQAGSPCIDAGDDAVIAPGDLDLDGNPRRLGAHVDIGAYEVLVPGAFTLTDAARALSIAAGLASATSADATRLALYPGPISAADACGIARKAMGLDPNP